MEEGALLEVCDLVAGYRAPVVGPLSFRLSPGDILGLSGPNGSGKSTVISAISGTAQVFRGSIRRRKDLTVAHQSQHPVRLSQMPLRCREFLALTGVAESSVPQYLAQLSETRVDRLSGGQFQILQVWAALGSPAALVLLDEPTNNMDPEYIDVLIGALRQLGSSRAALVVSHNADFLGLVCHTILEAPSDGH